MEGSIRLSAEQRKGLLKVYRGSEDAKAARKAHIVLLLADGWSYREVRVVAYASHDLIAQCVRRFEAGGVEALVCNAQTEEVTPSWLATVTGWLLGKQPEDFGYFRSRWTCEMLAESLAWETRQRLSRETIRRGLRQAGLVWRRPRPVVGPTDPDYEKKLRRIRGLLASLADDETAVFQDEVDVHLNPKIGSCWMLRGQQAEVVTPGNNVKRHLAGSLVWRTGTLLVSPAGTQRNARLFVAHLDDLRRRLRAYHRIHVICDNAPFHKCRLVDAYLARWGHRIEIHYLPKYAPETNPIERVWWHFHETITRNHRCRSIDELLTVAQDWIDDRSRRFPIETSQYPTPFDQAA
jgi:putative transposase